MIDEAIRAVRARTKVVPDAAIILGTGLGGLANEVAVETRIPYGEIPGFPLATVESHAGELLVGTLAGRRVVAMRGRFHVYEGYTPQQIGLPVRVLERLGARTLLVSNACGGMHPLWNPGDLMLIADHINLLGSNPLVGPNDDRLGPRFPDMSEAYDSGLRALARGRRRPRSPAWWAACWSASTDDPPGLRPQALGRRAGEAAARGVEARALVPEDAGGRALRTAVRVLRGAADGQRAPGHPSRVRAHHQGSGVPLPHDAGAGRDAHRGLGHPRPPRRDRGRADARHFGQEADRGVRRRKIQPPVPRERLQVQDRLGSAVGADRLLAGLRAPLRHLHQRVHRDGVVAAQAAVREGAPLSRP